ncbi:uncharacterized protein [Nicotiana tomentosiformis]|uniref:uncharacterized protein n=1 Tax=Nicotiana tomentosiformis TaxID=4098 RepID=UPI00388CDFD7
MMLFGLKNTGATYMRAMTNIFHDMIHKKIEVYVDDITIKSKKSTDHIADLRKFFDRLWRIKEYLSTPPVLVPPELDRPLLLYLSVLDGDFGCVLGQHDETGRKEHAIYYLSKKFTPYEARVDSLKYIFQKSIPIGKLAKWQILLSEFDIIYVSQKAVKGKALADHLAETSVGGEYEPLKIYFPDEEVSFIGEDIAEAYDGWRMFFDVATKFKGVGIGAVLVSKIGQHYPISAKLRFSCTNNMAEYEACILGINLAIDINIQELLVIGDSDLLIHQVQGEWATKNTKILPYLYRVQEMMKRLTKIEFRHVPRIQNEFADALATLSSMIQHPNNNFIDPISVRIHNYPAFCAHIEEEADGNPWFDDIKEYLATGEYPDHANHTKKCTLRRLSNHFFQSEGILYRRTPDIGLLRCGRQGSIQTAQRDTLWNLRTTHEWFSFSQEDTEGKLLLDDYGNRLHQVEIPSLRIIQEAELSDAEWIRSRYEQLALIDGKRMNAVCHGQL